MDWAQSVVKLPDGTAEQVVEIAQMGVTADALDQPDTLFTYSKHVVAMCRIYTVYSGDSLVDYILDHVDELSDDTDPDLAHFAEVCLSLAFLDGHAGCGYLLGRFMESGVIFRRNIRRASQFLNAAMHMGAPEAAVALGRLYETGELGEPDYAMAFALYSFAAASSSSAWASVAVGDLYAHGHGVMQDTSMALTCWLESIRRADTLAEEARASLRLAPYYLDESGTYEPLISPDKLQALMRYQTAEIGYHFLAKRYGLKEFKEGIIEARAGQARVREML